MKYEELFKKGYERLKEVGLDSNMEKGSETSASISKDRAYLDSLSLEMRLIDSIEADTRTELLGVKLNSPIMTGAMSGMNSLSPEPLLDVAKGVKEAGSMMWVGISSSKGLAEVINTGVPTIKIVKPYKDDQLIFEKMKEAEELGAIAVGMDIDFFFGGKRGDDILMPVAMAPKSEYQILKLKESVNIPFVIKGILSLKDVYKALDIGAEILVVSNHGEAVLDHAISPLQILPDIVEITRGKALVFTDSGLKRGTDILKALALGADGVLLGKQIMLGLAADREKGVSEILSIITEELKRSMSITGCRDIKAINSSILWSI